MASISPEHQMPIERVSCSSASRFVVIGGEAECKPAFCPPEMPDCYTAVTALTKDLGYLLHVGGGRDM